MDMKRYSELNRDMDAKLTPEELAEGYWFCGCEWDGLLIHKDDMEAKYCGCYQDELKALQAVNQ